MACCSIARLLLRIDEEKKGWTRKKMELLPALLAA